MSFNWQLRANTDLGWRSTRSGTGATSVVLERVPIRPVWIVAWPEGATGLTKVERLLSASAVESGRVTLELGVSGAVHGKFVDSKGKPVASVQVEVVRVHPPHRPKWAVASDVPSDGPQRAVSDAKGEYRVEGLALGKLVLQARHFDYREKVVGGIRLDVPGGERRVDLSLERGIHLKGRILTRAGAVFRGVRVHFLREAQPRLFVLDSWTVASVDGSFLSPTLPLSGTYKIKLQAIDDGHVSVVEHRVDVQLDGPSIVDVGTIAPFGTTAVFRLPETRPPGRYVLVASSAGTWRGEPRHLVVANVEFSPLGRVTISGFPLGKLSWSLQREVPDGRELSVGTGTVTVSDGESRFLLSLDKIPDPRDYLKPPEVHAPRRGPSPVDVLLLRDGGVEYATTAPADGKLIVMPDRLKRGSYELIVRQGRRAGRHAVQVPGTRLVELAAPSVGLDIRIRLVRGLMPVSDGEVSVLAMNAPKGVIGRRSWTTRCDKDGVVHIQGLPADLTQVTLSLMDLSTRSGRRIELDLPSSGLVTFDLDG